MNGSTFTCLRCGSCCKDIPLQQVEFDMFRYILKSQGRWDADSAQYYPDRRIYKLRGICPFLNIEDEGASCDIYTFRPTICKMFPLTNECPTTRKIIEMENSDE